MAKKQSAAKALDKQIERIYYESCQNVEIDMLDIEKVFKAGRDAHASGQDIKEAILAEVARLRKN